MSSSHTLQGSSFIARAQQMSLVGISVVEADGHYVMDGAGNRYLDCLSAASSVPLGYGREDLVARYVEQCARVPHTCMVYTGNTPSQEIARDLCVSSGIPDSKALLGLCGSDAVEAAIKAARLATGKSKIISANKSYHGGTALGLQHSGYPDLKKGLSGSAADSIMIPYPGPKSFEDTLRLIEEAIMTTADVAAVLLESIMGDGGCVVPPQIFYQKLSDLLDKHKVLLILDEIQSGMGRTGKLWAFQHFQVKPDLVCVGKALGGGYVPLSACIGRAEILDSLKPAQHAFTLAGHAASCAVGVEVLSLVSDKSFLVEVSEKGRVLTDYLNGELSAVEQFGGVRGLGLMLGVSLSSARSLGPLVAEKCLEGGVYVGYFGELANVLRFHPHLNCPIEELLRAAEVLVEAVKSVGASAEDRADDSRSQGFFS